MFSLRNHQTYFPEWPCHFTFSSAMYERYSVIESSLAFGTVIFYFSCSDRYMMIFHHCLNLHSLMASNCWTSFSCDLLTIHLFFLVMSFMSVAHFQIGLILFCFCCSVLRILNILIWILCQLCTLHIFSSSVWLVFLFF